MRSVHGSNRGWQMLKAKRKPTHKSMKCYERRNERLMDLGYSMYAKYLESDEWKVIRSRKLERYKECLLCRKKASQVHHLSYAYQVLVGNADHELVQVCAICHEFIEFDDGRKREQKEANKVLLEAAEKLEWGKKWIVWRGHQQELLKRRLRLENRARRRENKMS